jgi:uncharacterized membrane protein
MAENQPKTTRQIIRSFEAKAMKKRPWHDRFADNLTIYFGSMSFLVLNVILFGTWIVANHGLIPGLRPFDPFPFVLLITAVSIEAIILTTIVLMSQNRQGIVSSMRSELELQVNLIVEREVTKVLQLLTALLKHHGVAMPEDPELEKMLKVTNISYIQRKLEEQVAAEQPRPLQQVVTKPLVKIGAAVEKTVKTAQENHKGLTEPGKTI